jgi:NAD(P)-dependent dehydrogenase (short-subunit alcohol dehydrogenase family)
MDDRIEGSRTVVREEKGKGKDGISMKTNDSRGAVVITGASSGIGRSCALWLDGLGFRVLAGVRRKEDGISLQSAASGRLTPLMLDVVKPESVRTAAAAVAEAVGDSGLAGLVNNAGIAVAGPLEFLPLDLLEEQLKVNLLGPVAVTQALLPLIRKGGGRIVNISSDNGKVAWPYLAPYCASKYALEAVSDSLRMELREWKIPVILIEPGSIKTAIWGRSKRTADELVARMPAQGMELYGPVIKKLYKITELMESSGIPPEAVARAVALALTASRPKPRYIVGLDARLQILVNRVLPTRLSDWLILQLISRFGGSVDGN